MIIAQKVRLPKLRIGRKWELTFKFPFDMTGWKVRMQVRTTANKTSPLVIEPDVTEVSTGATESVYTIAVAEADSLNMDRLQGDYPYEIVLTNTNGDNEPYLYGDLPIDYDVSEVPV